MTKAEEIAARLTERIYAGEFPDDKLPSAAVLGAEHKVSRQVGFQALQILAQQGVAFARGRQGYFVKTTQETPEDISVRDQLITELTSRAGRGEELPTVIELHRETGHHRTTIRQALRVVKAIMAENEAQRIAALQDEVHDLRRQLAERVAAEQP